MFPLKDDNPTQTKPIITLSIIFLCILIFLYQFSLSDSDNNQLIMIWGMKPANLFSDNLINTGGPGVLLTLFSSMFLHGGIMHLAGNMLFLWIYGNNIEDAMGHIRFLIFYIICGLSAALLQAFVIPSSSIPMIGASGAVSGVLSAYFLLFPRAKVSTLVVLVFFITVIRLPAGILIGIWFFTQLLNATTVDPNSPGVAWFAHIGGFLAGAILIPFLKRKKFKFFSKGQKNLGKKNSIKLRFRK
tara:strand:+ start:220 stop:951 length:732 start_codon:yes stop_codon:yes gene_type:complete